MLLNGFYTSDSQKYIYKYSKSHFMFSSEVITFFFLSVIVCYHLLKFLGRFSAINVKKFTLSFAIASSIYCILAGLFLLYGWQDPLTGVSAESIANTQSRYKGIFLIVVKYWPFVLIWLGITSTITYSRTLLSIIRNKL